jgi:hypothetical protein
MLHKEALAYEWQRDSRCNAGNAARPLDSLANTAPKLDRAEEEGSRLTEVTADSWSFLSKEQYVGKECARAAAGAHRHFSIVYLRRNAFTT